MIDDENESEITMDEIMKALKRMKIGKAAGYDRVSSEMLKGELNTWLEQRYGRKPQVLPTFDQFMEFLDGECRLLNNNGWHRLTPEHPVDDNGCRIETPPPLREESNPKPRPAYVAEWISHTADPSTEHCRPALPTGRDSGTSSWCTIGTPMASYFPPRYPYMISTSVTNMEFGCGTETTSSEGVVHLEVVSNLSRPAFLDALGPFISQRGLHVLIRSECGANFVGLDSHLRDLYICLRGSQYVVGRELSKRDMAWMFDPPLCLHWSGLFEAAVGSAKMHLLWVIGEDKLTFEELFTVF
ncbi:hypothetical protein EVAR_42817_1 [Eumeta japonica]|uniref:Uncharacterized protein n=1 Tax=Eumeta variegata TaxID=151549 RepID=A0A4C1WFC6_EUMVA|nr:hypothetical protein EVAR_42817_1 [Eumeta japonica]